MKKTALITLILSVASTSLIAQVPPFISYQSRVTDSSGVGLGTGTPINRIMVFKIYSTATGGTATYTEQQTVTIANGEYSVLIGNGTAVGTAAKPAFDSVFTSPGVDRYLGVTVDNGSNTIDVSDVEISPRQRITSTAYSFRARSADSVATGIDLQLNGSPNYGLGYYGTTLNVNTFGAVSVDGPVLYGFSGGALGSASGATKNIALKWDGSGNVSVGSLTSTGSLSASSINSTTSVKASGISGYLFNSGDLDGGIFSPADGVVSFKTNNAERLRIDGSGNVGIGTTTPGERLVIVGSGSNSASAALQVFNSALGSLFFVRNDGNIGIGTSAPTNGARLDVAGKAAAHVIQARTSVTTHDQGAYLEWNRWSDGATNINNHKGSLSGGFTFSEVDSANNYTERMKINASGNVGIGTNSPAARLHIKPATDNSGGNL